MSTAIVGHRTQPHDPFDTGKIGTAASDPDHPARNAKPAMAWRKIPFALAPGAVPDLPGPDEDLVRPGARAGRRIRACCRPRTIPMQPWLDVAEGGWATIVVTDGDRALAERLADELADLAWSMRDDFQVREAVPVDEAVRMADAAERGVVVLSDTGDTVFGGAAGDSNLILEAMLRLGIKGRALVPLISPEAANRLADAGEGATVTLPLGGDAATAFFKPIEVTGTVRKVGGGVIQLADNHQSEVDMGRRSCSRSAR